MKVTNISLFLLPPTQQAYVFPLGRQISYFLVICISSQTPASLTPESVHHSLANSTKPAQVFIRSRYRQETSTAHGRVTFSRGADTADTARNVSWQRPEKLYKHARHRRPASGLGHRPLVVSRHCHSFGISGQEPLRTWHQQISRSLPGLNNRLVAILRCVQTAAGTDTSPPPRQARRRRPAGAELAFIFGPQGAQNHIWPEQGFYKGRSLSVVTQHQPFLLTSCV